MWVLRYFTYEFYLVMIRLNGRANEFPSKKMREAIYAGMGLFGMWFVPFVLDWFVLDNILVYKEYSERIGSKNMGIVLFGGYVLCLELLFFRKNRWLKHVSRCQNDPTPVRRMRVVVIGVVVLVMFVGSMIHFFMNIPR